MASDLENAAPLHKPNPSDHLTDLVPALPARRRAPWRVAYVAGLVSVDVAALLLAGLAAALVRFGATEVNAAPHLPYWALVLGGVPAWVGTVALSGGYETRVLGHGTEEYKRLFNALARFAAVAAMGAYASQVEVARTFMVGMIVGTIALSLLGRAVGRRVLRAARRRGLALRRVLIVGTPNTAFPMASRLARDTTAGFSVVGLCAGGGRDRRSPSHDVPFEQDRRRLGPQLQVIGPLSHVAAVVREHDIDTVAVAPSSAITPEALRHLAWELEETGVDLVVAPALVDVAGPRIHVGPVAGLPLLHISTPEFSGVRHLVKSTQDRLLAVLAVIITAPVMAAIAVAIRRDTPGPVLFRQTRVGQGGQTFGMIKFRSMYVGAEERLDEVADDNKHGDGPLFKAVDDPRVTPVGRFLRKWSLDELPQLFNVLGGEMSIVGPRPPLVSEVLDYDSQAVYRRLMVKPGLTGLWQVSGRADLPWHEAVRLDLYYVENWSPALDATILWRTLGAVLERRGAY